MENYVAIFVSIAAFLFTLYQWWFTMNSKRPKLIVKKFQPDCFEFSQKFNYLLIYLPKDYFIINSSELPNAIINMNLYAKIGKKWLKGKFIYYDLVARDGEEKAKSPWPLGLMGHTYHRFESVGQCYYTWHDRMSRNNIPPFAFEFPVSLTAPEIERVPLCLEIEDLYGKKHCFSCNHAHNFPQTPIYEYPNFYWEELGLKPEHEPKSLADIELTDEHGKLTQILQIVYTVNHDHNEQGILPWISVIQYKKNSVDVITTIYQSSSADWHKSSGPAFLVKEDFVDGAQSSKLILHIEDKVPKALELELVVRNQHISKKVDFPADFIQSLASEILTYFILTYGFGIMKRMLRIVYTAKHNCGDRCIEPYISVLSQVKSDQRCIAQISRDTIGKWRDCSGPTFVLKENFVDDAQSSKLILHIENEVPKALELEVVAYDQRISEKKDLPAEFIQSLTMQPTESQK